MYKDGIRSPDYLYTVIEPFDAATTFSKVSHVPSVDKGAQLRMRMLYGLDHDRPLT